MRALRAFGQFWWDFVIGEDWRVAAGVVAALALGAVLAAVAHASNAVVALATAGAIMAMAIGSIVFAGVRARRRVP